MAENLARLALYARQQTRTDNDADDVLQEAIIEAWKREPQKCPDLPLVFSYIRRRAIDLGRKIKVRQDFAESSDVPLTSIETNFEQRDDEHVLRSSLGELPPELSETVVLHLWGSLTFREIGEMLSISQNTAASRYRIALERLRQTLKTKLR